MQGPSDQFLTHAGLAENQDAGVGARNLGDHAKDLFHPRALADDVLEAGDDHFAVEDLDLDLQAPVLQPAIDLHLQFLEVERLQHVVVGSRLHRLDRGFDRAVGRHHQHQGPFVEHLGAFDDVQATGSRHFEVRDDDVEDLAFEGLERLLGVGGRYDPPAPILKSRDHSFPETGLIFDDEDLFHSVSPLPPPARPSAAGLRFPPLPPEHWPRRWSRGGCSRSSWPPPGLRPSHAVWW